jgi:hypothetical protein
MRRNPKSISPRRHKGALQSFQLYPRDIRRPNGGLMPWAGPRERFNPEGLPLVDWFDPGQGVYRDGAALFTGTTQYLSFPDGDIGYTFGGWFLVSDMTRRHMLISKGDEYYVEYSFNTGRFRLLVDNTHQVLAGNLGQPSLSQWYFIVCWHDPAANLICIQINDGGVDSAAYPGGSPIYNSGFNVGAYEGGLTLDGKADSVFFYKRLLSAAERTELYHAGTGKNYSELSSSLKTSLVSWWEMEQAGGSRLDSHGGNTLADHGGVSLAGGVVASPAQPGDAVSLWVSRAGLGHVAAQSAMGKRPALATDINGVPYLSFDGVDDLLEINGCAACFTGKGTLVAGFSPLDTNYSLYHASASNGWWAHGSGVEFGDFRGSAIVGYPTGNPLVGGNHVVSISSSAGGYEVRVDGFSGGAQSGGFSVLDKHSIGGSWESADRPFRGRVHGIFLCNEVLMPHRLQQAERFLANKNGATTL